MIYWKNERDNCTCRTKLIIWDDRRWERDENTNTNRKFKIQTCPSNDGRHNENKIIKFKIDLTMNGTFCIDWILETMAHGDGESKR